MRTEPRHPNAVRLAACALFLAAGCTPPHPEPLRLQWNTMGTVAAVQCVDHASAPQAREIAQSTFDDLDRELSAWKEESALSAANRAAGSGHAVPLPPRFAALLRTTLSVCEASGGAFNPLIGPVMWLWGFNGAPPRTTVPTEAERLRAAELADWRAIRLSEQGPDAALLLPKAGMQLDLGGIAKGYAVDAAWTRLTAAGHTNLLIDLGGNLRAVGEAAPGRGGWRTGIRNPFDSTLVAFFLMGSGEAVATSGNYERFVEIEGVRYAHIMDPRSGLPVTGMAGTTVVAPDATTADALSTALFILGPREGARLLTRFPGCEALWIPDTPDALNLIATPGLAKRLAPLGPALYTLTVLTL